MRDIYFVIGNLKKGGGERVVSILANYFSSRYKVGIITLLGNDIEYDINSNINIVNLSRKHRRLSDVWYWVREINLIAKTNRPIFISFFARINILVLAATIFTMNTVIISERNDPNKDGRGMLVKCLTRLMYPLSSSIVFQTRYALKAFPKYLNKKSHIIPNPVIVNSIYEGTTSKSFVGVGRLESQKDFAMMINSFEIYHKQHPDWQLNIFGEGSLRSNLQRLIHSKNLDNVVFLRGLSNNIHTIMAQNKMLLVTSSYEGMPNVILEAKAIGIPILTTRFDGIDDIMIHEYNGFIVSSRDPHIFAEKLTEYVCNDSLLRIVSENARRDLDKHSLTNITKQWERLF